MVGVCGSWVRVWWLWYLWVLVNLTPRGVVHGVLQLFMQSFCGRERFSVLFFFCFSAVRLKKDRERERRRVKSGTNKG
jgi:hypothetical protein